MNASLQAESAPPAQPGQPAVAMVPAAVLERLLSHFPTHTDMVQAGWPMADVDGACEAVQAAYAALVLTSPARTSEQVNDCLDRIRQAVLQRTARMLARKECAPLGPLPDFETF